ncbi:MAG TPA: GNAT family protein [Bacillales bacterium]|nr:GNAT family protein [Bacillales bacterium]
MKRVELKNDCQVLIREAIPDDAERLNEIGRSVMMEECYSVMTPNEFKQKTEKEKQWIQDHLDHPGKTLFVAEIDEKVIGFINFQNGARARLAHVGSLGISIQKDFREAGVGRALMETLLEWAQDNPLIEKVALAVFSNNKRAIHLYEKLGFAEEGRRSKEIKFAENHYVDDILMYKFV